MYIPDFDWYIVVKDYRSINSDFNKIALPSIIVFLCGVAIIVLIFALVVKQENKLARVSILNRRLSYVDKLTGLLNRNAYEEESSKYLTLEDDSIVMVLDINGLKMINDTVGHMAGDEMIIMAASFLKECFKDVGRIYRTGGDEFVVIINADDANFSVKLEEFNDKCTKAKGNYVQELSMSYGVVKGKNYPELSFKELVQMADRLMYEDKNEYYRRTGKNRRKC